MFVCSCADREDLICKCTQCRGTKHIIRVSCDMWEDFQYSVAVLTESELMREPLKFAKYFTNKTRTSKRSNIFQLQAD